MLVKNRIYPGITCNCGHHVCSLYVPDAGVEKIHKGQLDAPFVSTPSCSVSSSTTSYFKDKHREDLNTLQHLKYSIVTLLYIGRFTQLFIAFLSSKSIILLSRPVASLVYLREHATDCLIRWYCAMASTSAQPVMDDTRRSERASSELPDEPGPSGEPKTKTYKRSRSGMNAPVT